jgi:NADPH-dependent glutamate synthase beta subunit-like oxidoreductase
MPAAPEEVEDALHEGVEIIFLAAPNEIRPKKDSTVELECTRMQLGEPDASGRRRPEPIPNSEFVMEFDNVIASIGQVTDIPANLGVDLGRGNVIKADSKTLATSRQGVFAGGDAVTGPASVIEAIAHGRQAASSIDKYLGGTGVIDEALAPIETLEPWLGPDGDFASKPKPHMPALDNKERLAGFPEVELGYPENTGKEEANRCLRCELRLGLSSTLPPPTKVKTA